MNQEPNEPLETPVAEPKQSRRIDWKVILPGLALIVFALFGLLVVGPLATRHQPDNGKANVGALPVSVPSASATMPTHLAPFQTNIVKATAANQDFRRVLFTGANSQLVVMSIPPGGEVGQETHQHVEQILYFQSGTGEAILNGKVTPIGPGDVVIVTPGTQHNFINTGKVPMKITTTYAPPNHISGRIHHTKADADADHQDEAFGEAQ